MNKKGSVITGCARGRAQNHRQAPQTGLKPSFRSTDLLNSSSSLETGIGFLAPRRGSKRRVQCRPAAGLGVGIQVSRRAGSGLTHDIQANAASAGRGHPGGPWGPPRNCQGPAHPSPTAPSPRGTQIPPQSSRASPGWRRLSLRWGDLLLPNPASTLASLAPQTKSPGRDFRAAGARGRDPGGLGHPRAGWPGRRAAGEGRARRAG